MKNLSPNQWPKIISGGQGIALRGAMRAPAFGKFLLATTQSLALAPLLIAGVLPSLAAVESWPQWRGPAATGAALEANPPLEWSETKNVKWKIKTPGFGTSTPIVWGDRVFILTAIPTGKKIATKKPETPAAENPPGSPEGRRRGGTGGGPAGGFRSEIPDEAYQFVVLCLDRNSGKTLWQKVAREQVPHEGHHKDHGFASASPVTDGEHLFVSFGSRGLFCFDLDGKLKWEADFGKMQTRNSFGEG
ncbi:MAG: PQQ-binding-like beta-propeller repeat protein, partial [Verrucomicrobiota bacterium]